MMNAGDTTKQTSAPMIFYTGIGTTTQHLFDENEFRQLIVMNVAEFNLTEEDKEVWKDVLANLSTCSITSLLELTSAYTMTT